ncbi:MAG: hypothetical protein M3T56_03265 [Chloroflexota bacterium]|nr:hypothetical protein [Chloroflexota bacterium]
MTDPADQLETFYAAFFGAHVAILAIALPVSAAFLLPQAERYSARVLPTLLGDWPFRLLLLLIIVSAAPSAAGL